MTLKYSEVEGYDAEAVAAANRAYEAQQDRLPYPPYVPAIPGYEVPQGREETEAMSAAIFAWHERWAQARAGVSLSS